MKPKPYSRNFSSNITIFVSYEKTDFECEISLTNDKHYWWVESFFESNIHSISTYFNDGFKILEISI